MMSIPISQNAQGDPSEHRDILRAFISISRALNLDQPLSETLDLIAEKVSQTMGHKYCAVLLADEQTKDLRIHGAFGLSHKYIQTLNNELVQKTQGGGPMSRSVTAQAYRTRMPVYAPDITSDQRFTTWREAALEAGYKSIVALPLIFREQTIGVLNCYDEPRSYSEEQVEALTVVAEQAASAAGIARLIDEQRKTISELNRINEHFASQHELLQRSASAHESLTSLLLEDCSLDGISATLAALLRSPVVLQDEELRILSRFDYDNVPHDGLPAHKDESTSLEPPLSVLKRSGRARVVRPISASGSPSERRTLLFAPVELGNHESGYLSIPLAEGTAEPFASRTMEQAATVFALYMARQRAAREAEDRLREDLLTDLLHGRLEDAATLRDRAHYLGVDFTKHQFRIIVVRHEALSEYVHHRGGDSRTINQTKGRLVTLAREFASDTAAREGAGYAVTDTESNHIIMLLPFPRDLATSAMAERLVNTMRRRFPELHLRVAVSGICESSDKLRAREKEARSLLDLADRLDLSDQEVCYDDWKLYGLLLRGGSREDFSEIAHRYLDPIIRYDLRYDSDLLETLVAYLNSNLSPSRTSRALFVHLNTVKYRLRRISTLLDSDLGDLHVVLTLQVALMQRDLAPEAFDAFIE